MKHKVVFIKSARHGMLASIFVLYSIFAHAKNAENLSFDAALGVPSMEITNPNGTTSGYGGISLEGRFVAPLLTNEGFSVSADIVGRYYDLENEYSNSQESEIAKHMGPGAGILINLGKIFLGYEYMMMKATHYYVGSVGYKKSFDYNSSNAFIGIDIPLGSMSAGLGYSMNTATISKDETGLTKDSELSEQTIWIHIRYVTDSNVSKIASKLVD